MTKSTTRYDVVIAGGGMVGLSLAVALAELAPRGFRIAIVDAQAFPPAISPESDPRASALSAATRHLLEALNLWPALADHAQPVAEIEVTDSPLEAHLRPHFLGFDGMLADRETATHILANSDLVRALAASVAASAAISIISPDSVIGFSPGTANMNIDLASGGTLHAQLLVGADGKKSLVREAAAIKCVRWSYAQIGIVTTVAHAKPHHGKAVQHFFPSGPFAMLPLKGNRSSIVWSEETEAAKAIMQANDAAFLAELARRFGYRLGEIGLAGPRASFPLDFQVARSFAASRVALIGDAARSVHPLAGQGLNIGMRDVAALAETIVDAARLGLDIGGVAVLERYQRWRRFDSAVSATAMDALNRIFSNDSLPLRGARDVGLSLVERTSLLKRFFVREAAGLTGDVPQLLRGMRP